MTTRTPYTTIDEYLATVPADARRVLKEIRRIVRRTVPDAEELISYRMPAFRRDRIVLYFAAFKTHVGIFPPVTGDAVLLRALRPYRGPKGNLRFPLDRPIPYALIGRVVKALARQSTRRRA